jgi:hypothetical protein
VTAKQKDGHVKVKHFITDTKGHKMAAVIDIEELKRIEAVMDLIPPAEAWLYKNKKAQITQFMAIPFFIISFSFDSVIGSFTSDDFGVFFKLICISSYKGQFSRVIGFSLPCESIHLRPFVKLLKENNLLILGYALYLSFIDNGKRKLPFLVFISPIAVE